MPTFRDLLAQLRSRTVDITETMRLPVLANPTRYREEVDPQMQRRILRIRRDCPTPLRSTTRSDSDLFRYEHVYLGIRQLLVLQATHAGVPLPAGFGNTPLSMLAMLGQRLEVLDPWPDLPLHQPTRNFTAEAAAVIDNWEDSGLGRWAGSAFMLAHVYIPSLKLWTPVTPAMEQAALR